MMPIDMALVTALTNMKTKAGDLAVLFSAPGRVSLGLGIGYPLQNQSRERRLAFPTIHALGHSSAETRRDCKQDHRGGVGRPALASQPNFN
jgi:hypothetical protein